MKNLSVAILISLGGAISGLPTYALATPEPEQAVVETQTSNAELDSMLAPIALYPDTLLTHILIASTYPLEVVAADRWRQSNLHLTVAQVEQALAPVSWDPSVKALASFSDVLHTMAEDLDWLQQLGDNVLISEARVLDRVQALRQQAYHAGTLASDGYLEIEREIEQVADTQRNVIVIAPRHRDVVYVPYYDPLVVFGLWTHAIAPVHWHHRVSYRHHGNFFWAPQIRLSTSFYFGGIQWNNRHVVIHREPVRRYYKGTPHKRAYSKGYQRWQHNAAHRKARYSNRVVHNAPKRYTANRTVKVRNHERANTKVINKKVVNKNTINRNLARQQSSAARDSQIKRHATRNINTDNKQVKASRNTNNSRPHVVAKNSKTTRTVTTTKTVRKEGNKQAGQKSQLRASTHVKRSQAKPKDNRASYRSSASQQSATRNVNRNRNVQSKSHSQR